LADLEASRAPARLTTTTKLFYGLGETAEGLKTATLETFLFFYYVQVVGLSGALAGAALMVALLVDGVSDPLVGAWSDKVWTRLGRRHPFLYAAPAPLALALYGLFRPPTGLSPVELFVWLAALAVCSRVAMTLYFVPHMALGAELSQDFGERVSVAGYRVLFGYLGRILALGLAFQVFFHATTSHRAGQLDPTSYPPFAMTCGVLVVIFVVTSALGTQGPTLRMAIPVRRRPSPGINVWGQLTLAMRSTSFSSLFFALLVMYVFGGVQATLALHMNTYFWRLAPGQAQFVFYASLAGFILGIPITRPLANRFDKKRVYMAGVGASCLILSAPTILRLLGWFPANGEPAVLPILVAANLVYGLVGSVPVVLSAAMLADLADEFEFTHGYRQEGLFFGVNAFCRKASLGLGGAMAGVTLDLIGFPSKIVPAAAPSDALIRLGMVFGPGVLVILFGGLGLLLPYNLTREKHRQIVQALLTKGSR
jgi:glycoside/pentoside/hexuronide:cation symporter, GPH family